MTLTAQKSAFPVIEDPEHPKVANGYRLREMSMNAILET